MKKIVALVLFVGVAAAVIGYQASAAMVAATQKEATFTQSSAIALAQRLHDELNLLEVAGRIEEQGRYYSDNVVRLDQGRTPQQGKAAFLAYATEQRQKGYNVSAATTTVLNAWVENGLLVEYGTTLLQGSFGTGGIVEDPVNYQATWLINPADPNDAQIQTIIWNTQVAHACGGAPGTAAK